MNKRRIKWYIIYIIYCKISNIKNFFIIRKQECNCKMRYFCNRWDEKEERCYLWSHLYEFGCGEKWVCYVPSLIKKAIFKMHDRKMKKYYKKSMSNE